MAKLNPSLLAVALIALCLGATGCGGSGGGNSFGSGSLFAPPPPVPPADPAATAFETPEFVAAVGLDKINAQHAYARNGFGQGITVAVVDTGVEATHADLAANMHPASRNIRTGGAIDDLDGHGTAVAGIIGAVRNAVGIHGVAYQSQILGLRTDNCDAAPPPGCTGVFLEPDIASAINFAVAQGARVINMSLGGPGTISAVLQTAIRNAATAGVAMTAAAGNSGTAEPEAPANFATDAGALGLLLAVVAVDSNNVIADFGGGQASAHCGAAAQFCVAAPGVSVGATNLGGGTASFSGTSAATPYVSGAIAVLMSLFPALTTQQVVTILLTTATDLGLLGTDSVYGRGLINLHLAAQPSGILSVPLGATNTGPGAAVLSTHISLGPAFGNALGRYRALLDNSIAVDFYGRGYKVNLSDRVATAARPNPWISAIAPDTMKNVNFKGPLGLSASFSLHESDPTRERLEPQRSGGFTQNEARPTVQGLSVYTSLGKEMAFKFSHNLSGAAFETETAVLAASDKLFLSAHDFLSPQTGLLGTGTGAAVIHRLGRDTKLQLGWFEGTADTRNVSLFDETETGRTSFAYAGVSRRFRDEATIGLRFSNVNESDSFLGTHSSGAFGADMSANSQFLTASAVYSLSRNTRLVASYTEALTRVDQGSDDLLSGWSDVRANAFGAGVVSDSVFADGDQLGFIVGQPLRVYSARATLTLPEAVNADSTLSISSQRIDVTPTGREVDMQLAYSREVLDGVLLQGWAIARFQPDHDRNAAPDFGVGFKVSASF